VLADAVSDPVMARVLSDGTGLGYELMIAADHGMAGMITGSRRRVLAHLLAGDPEAAAQEMEHHLHALHFLWRISESRSRRASA
jgi:DNA-binding FadR family transcriptional regulator